jgi:hypothetical protein
LLASAEVSEEDAAVVKQFVPEGCKVDAIEKADLNGDGKPELVFTYTGKEDGLIILKWDGVKYMKQWEYESFSGIKGLKVQDITNDGKPEILLCCNSGSRILRLAVFTWDGKTYKLLGANGAEEEFYSQVNMPDVAPGIIRVYRSINASTTFARDMAYPMPYKWDGNKFVPLYSIREGSTFGSLKAEKPCKIDGKLDDWGLEGIPVYDEKAGPQLEDNEGANQVWYLITHVELGRDKHDVLFRPENWRGILDLGAWFDTKWDEKTLHIVVQVADDKLVQEWQGDSLYKGDHVEIWFDTDLAGDFDLAKANGDDFQIGISPGDFKELKPSVYCWLPKLKEGNIKEAEVAAKRTDDGYILEATIPFQFLGIEPKPEKMLGFTLLVSDTDEKEKPQKCMIGTSPQYKWGNPTTWDNFVLLNE